MVGFAYVVLQAQHDILADDSWGQLVDRCGGYWASATDWKGLAVLRSKAHYSGRADGDVDLRPRPARASKIDRS
jgi:hypothetical protein